MKLRCGIVFWDDAALHCSGGDFSVAPSVAIGAIKTIGQRLIVVFNFVNSDGKNYEPDTYLVIPKKWVTKIVWLHERRRK